MMYFFYQILYKFIYHYISYNHSLSNIKNKEDIKRLEEKFCIYSQKKNKGKKIWFHGASVGEIMSISSN